MEIKKIRNKVISVRMTQEVFTKLQDLIDKENIKQLKKDIQYRKSRIEKEKEIIKLKKKLSGSKNLKPSNNKPSNNLPKNNSKEFSLIKKSDVISQILEEVIMSDSFKLQQ